jgi:hypothetical protein
MLDELRAVSRNGSSPEVLDLYAAQIASDVSQYLQSSFQRMLQLAERSGLTQSMPKIGRLLEPGFKETKRSGRRLQKRVDKLVERLRPN